MQEAHGLIMDMMADSSLPPNVVSGLKTVSSLLSPPTSYNTLQRPKISPLVALSESNYGASDIDDSPYVGERPLSLPKVRGVYLFIHFYLKSFLLRVPIQTLIIWALIKMEIRKYFKNMI